MTASPVCPHCGRDLDQHNRHLRFRLPEPVLAVPEAERAERTWGTDVLTMVQGVGAFVRILVPVRLTGGYTVTYGAWLGVHPDDLKRAYDIWWDKSYATFEVEGRLANMLPPWENESYGRPLRAAVRDPDAVPYATESSDPQLQRILQDEWPLSLVLDAVAPYT